jgi:hypothetical protein
VILGSPPSIDAFETEAIIGAPLLASFGTPPLLNIMSISFGVAYRGATERHGGAVGHPSGRADAMSASGRGKASAKGGQATVFKVFSLWIVSGNSKKIPPLSAPPLIRGARGDRHCGSQ